MRIFKATVLASLAVLLCVLLLTASIPNVATGTWQTWNAMADARSGASAVLLHDGSVLIAGGANANGPTASADLFGKDGVFSAVAAMNSPRSNHAATLLGDGRVLVTGGDTGSGITNSAEVYNPATSSWTLLGATMLDARAGHTASLLPDGRVLLAGGHNSGGALSGLEIFDPLNDDFTSAGTLTAPRMNHAAAVLSDGRLLVIGGTADGTNALATVDIYDPVTHTVGLGPSLTTPRMSATATTTLDGKVAVIGGSNGSQDLASAEVFDPATGEITVCASSLATPRSGHNAFLLPNNNTILIVGGSSGGAGLISTELYFPWTDSFQTTGAMSVARPGLGGSATGLNGRFLAAGGANLASSELYGFATVKTDKNDYAPGEVVTITGSGWQPGETVTLTLVESPLIDTHPPMTAMADANGNIINTQFSPDDHDLNIRFYMTAVGPQSQAQITFTDSVNSVTLTSPTAASPITLSSFPLAANITFDYSTSTGTTTGVASVATSPATNSPTTPLASGLNQSATIPVTLPAITPNGTYNASVTVTNTSGGGANNKSDSANGGVLVDVPITQLVFTTSAFSIPVNACSGKITVESRDSTGAARNPFSNLTVLLGTTSGGGTFYSNSSCNTATTSVVIASNKTSMDFWYKDGNNGRPQITASTVYEAGPTLSATQLETIGTVAAPTITSISPSSATTGDPAFTMSVVGANFVLNSVANFAGSPRTTTFVDSTHLNATIPASDLTSTGNFNITVTTPAPGGGSSNAAVFTVIPACTAAAVTTQPTSQSITYGANVSFAATASGNPAPTVQWQVDTGSGFTNITGATNTSLTLISPPVSASGNQYRAVFTNTCGATQTATSNAATLTVSKASLTVTADDQSRQFGSTDPTFTFKITGFVNVETSSVLTTQPTCTTTATATSQASPPTYTISCSGAAAANYSFNYVVGALTITKASSATTVTGGTFTFDGDPHPATVLVSGAGGLSLTPAPSYSGACSAAPVHVSETTPSCTASYTFPGDANHDGSSGSATITITKAPSTTTVSGGGSFVFDGLAHTATVAVTGAGNLSSPGCK